MSQEDLNVAPAKHRSTTRSNQVHFFTQAAGMVVHPAPGNLTGTLVNAVLHHCNLPEYELPPEQGPQTLSPWPGDRCWCCEWLL